MRRFRAAALVAAIFAVTTAHVGSPDVVLDGNAGPYPVRVIVRPPNVVPGLADIVVRVNADSVTDVTMRPVFWRTGVAGSPTPDRMSRVASQPRVFTGQVWFMAYGAYSVYVTVRGPRGEGQIIVPVNSFATGRLGLSPMLAGILIVLGVVLFAGVVTLVRAGAGESLAPPGQSLDPNARRRANVVAAVAVPAFALALFGGAKWWNSVDAQYQRRMFSPPSVATSISTDSGHRTLRLVLGDTSALRVLFAAPVAPDHGKMMHLFLASERDKTTFAHLHPAQTDSVTFVGEVPWLPAGRYLAFGDVTFENGTALTATTTIDLPASRSIMPSDSDDAWASVASPARATAGAVTPLAHGYSLAWTGSSSALHAGTPVDLTFAVRDSAGRTTSLQPYLGMAAHAVIIRDDASVFIHLHPMGTVTPTAQRVFELRDRGDTTARGRLKPGLLGTDMPMPMTLSGSLTFPYQFPKPGHYRIWVQVKPSRDVLTGVFDLDVQ